METFLHDISWVPALRTPELTVLFNGLTWLGYSTFFLIFLPIGYWLWDKNMFTRLAVLIIITGILNGFLKDLFHDPRPPAQFSIDPRVGDSFGFPSGHAQIAIAMWFWLAYEIKRAWAWVAAVLIAIGVCASRLYVGVHDMEDVLGGALIGLSTIIAYRVFVSDEFKFWHDANPALQFIVIFALQAVVWFAWPGDKGPDSSFSLFGLLVGWWLGVVIDRSLIHFGRPANWPVVALISVVAVAALVKGFQPVEQFLMTQGLTKLWADWMVTAFIGLYATVFVPLLLRNIGVSQTAAP